MEKFVDSFAYTFLIGIAAFCCWFFDDSLIPSLFFALFAFFPLFGKEGKGYYVLILSNIIASANPIEFNGIPTQIFITTLASLVSLIIYTIIRKPRFNISKISYVWIAISLVMLISLIINVFGNKTDKFHINSVGYVSTFFLCIFLAMWLTSVVTAKDRLLHLSKAFAVFGLVICAQLITFFIRNPDLLGGRGVLTLGWANVSNVVSMYLVLTIPFFGILIYNKKLWAIGGYALVCICVMFTASRAGYLCLAVSVIPLVLLSFRSYGKKYPYICVSAFGVIFISVVCLFSANLEWLNEIIEAFLKTGFSGNGRGPLYQYGIDEWLKNPLLGTSANALFFKEQASGNINLLHNTYINYMVTGGILALLGLVAYYVLLALEMIKSDNKGKYHILLAIALLEIIGLIDNTMTNPINVCIVLVMLSTLVPLKDKKTVTIKQDYFINYRLNSIS